MAAMAVAEEIGALNWEETSSLSGHNVDLAFSLCGLAVSRRRGRVKRPSSLLLSAKPRAPPLYEDPDKASRQQGSDTDSLFSPPEQGQPCLGAPSLSGVPRGAHETSLFPVGNDPTIEAVQTLHPQDLPGQAEASGHPPLPQLRQVL